MTLTLESGLPAPAWVVEIIRRLSGPSFFVQQGRRPGQPHHLYRDDGTPRQRANVTRPLPMDPAPLRPPLAFALDDKKRDYIMLYSFTKNGVRVRDVVVSHFGNVLLTEREVAVIRNEIRMRHPNAEFKVMRDMPAMGGPKMDRDGDIPVLRYHAWP